MILTRGWHGSDLRRGLHAIDLEATNSDRDSACAVDVTMVRGGVITQSRSCLIRPHTSLDALTLD
ncbi:hypothetical protein ACIPY3_22150 [Paenarthrobacter sp. NPDC089714]|uniref:hypothetical protein n=1 Tax=Paenarthrobacter sp. NPDC089714 TaxID=3364377 RepID=UPI0037FFD9DC